MPPIIKLEDQNELVLASKFPLGKLKYESLNPVQSRVFELYDKDANLLVATKTGSGKTCCAEMFLAHEVRKRKGKGLYLAPYRSLAQEKYDEWTAADHHFADLKVSICTGDYRITDKRLKELEESDIIIMSSEMLNHRARHAKSEKSKFLFQIGTLVCDEGHLLIDPSRGHHLESGLMKITEGNKNLRLLMLSATMPNVDEIGEWVSYSLTHKETYVFSSKYRPVPLIVHYEKYYDGENSYDENELQKVHYALGIVEHYPEDKFLIFSHTKKTGELMKKVLLESKIDCDFHNADVEKSKRVALEEKFRKDKKFRVIIATSTMEAGVNLPARRLIVLGVHRGMEEVPSYSIIQQCGRSGRPGLDPVGDAYVLLPEKTFDMHKERLKKPSPITSQMLADFGGKYKNLAFHLVSEIHQENIKDRDDVRHWYKRSLASWQSHDLNEGVVDDTLTILKKCGAIWEEDGKITVTSVGKIASLFYYSPFDVSDLKRNFNGLFDAHKEEDDHCLSMALGNVDTQRCGIVSRSDRDEMAHYARHVTTFIDPNLFEPAIKAGYAYYQLLSGRATQSMAGYTKGLVQDFQRLNEVLNALDGFAGKWNKRAWLKDLHLRVTYGVKGPMVVLCHLPHIGRARANKLWNSGIKTIADVATNQSKLKGILGLKQELIDEIISAALRQK